MRNLVATYFYEQKNTGGYILAYVAAAILAGCLSILYTDPGVLYSLLKLIQLACFVGLGFMHATISERGLPFVAGRFPGKSGFTALLAVSMCIALLILYFFVEDGLLMMALASGCAFFLPNTFMQLWNFNRIIPETPRSMTWNGFQETLATPDIVYLSSIPVTFKLTTGYHIKTMEFFTIKAPLDMELSRVFNLCIVAAKKNHNIPLQTEDEDERTYEWEFYAERMKGLMNVQLDPATCIGDNEEIRSNTVIVARRVKPIRAFFIPRVKEDLQQ